jgi:mannosyltransferase
MDAVIATSDASASYLLRAATVILHGVDPKVYCPPADRAAAFAASGLPGKYGIGCFGRVREQKGTDLFVAAMCALLPKYPDFSAVIVGSVTLDQRGFVRGLQARVAQAGLTDRVRFLGELPIDEVPLWYQRISIYAFTSRNEGFGLTLLEAMAAGVALVAARAGGAERVVTDGQTGVLVPAGDVGALIAALEPLMRDPEGAAEMGRRARERVTAEFSVEAEAARITAVYRKVLEIDR